MSICVQEMELTRNMTSQKANKNKSVELSQQSALLVLVGGIFGMMVAMGIGRFAFTPIIPLMQRDLGMTNSMAGWLASLNYVGYLAGAILCAVKPRLLRSTLVNIGALTTSIATTLLMGLTISPVLWGVLRLTAGVASALLFVIIAIEVSEILARSRHSRWSSALYGGVGLGIALSGAVVPYLDRFGGWSATWLGMGVIAAFLAIAGIALAGKRSTTVAVPNEMARTTGSLAGISRLGTAYFLEGVGYIVSATFLVTMIAHTPGLAAFSPWSWVIVGLAAAPSTILWQLVAIRIGARQALSLAYILQAAGIFLSIYAGSALTAGLAAVIFGGTFLGIVALAMGEGARRSGAEGRRATAVLTACFGAGQVAGPPLAGLLADQQGGFSLALLLAVAAVTLGGVLVATDKGFSTHAASNNS